MQSSSLQSGHEIRPSILYISLEPSFLSIHALEMVNALAAVGADVTLICPAGIDGLGDLDHCIQQVFVPVADSWRDYLFVPLKLRRLLEDQQFETVDSIYVRQDIHHFLLPALLRKSARPYWAEFNQCASDVQAEASFLRRMLTRLMEACCLRHATHIVAPSQALGDVFTAAYPGLAREIRAKLKVLPNAANTRLFKPRDRAVERKRLGIAQDRFWIGFIGSLLPWQGVDLFAQAVNMLRETEERVQGLVVGGYDIYGETDTRRHLEAIPGFSDIHFTGRVSYRESACWMAACDLLVAPYTGSYPRFGGGAPMKVYAYLASGRAMVNAALDGWTEHEWIYKQGAGVSVPPDDVSALTAALRAMLDEPSVMEEMGRKGRRLAVREHDWRHRARSLLGWMQEEN